MTLAQPDPRLLERARGGDERAFEALVDGYRAPLLRYVLRMVGDEGLAEDLVQEVLLRVYRRLGSFRSQCLFTTWLFQVAKNRVLDELRGQARRPGAPVELTDEMVTHERSIERDGEIDETMAAIWRAVEELDADLKQPLLLRDVAGLSYREIGETLEIALPTVKWRIYTARETVQATLAAQHLSPEFGRAADAPRRAARPRAVRATPASS